MHWELSDEQELFTSSLREWLHERAGSSAVRNWLDTGDAAGFERLFVGEGWAGVGFEEDLGGQGGGLLELALTARELGRSAAPSAGWLQSAIVVPALAGEPELIRAAAESGEITALAIRADRIPAATSVMSSGDRLHGQIPCCTRCSPGADNSWCPSPTATRPRSGSWTARPEASEFTPSRCWIARETSPTSPLMTSRHADSISMRQRHSAKSPPGQPFSSPPTRWAHAERMLQLAVDYSKQRQQFGRPIGSFQAVKHAAAQMLVTVESSLSIVCYAAQSAEEGLPERATHAAVAKAQVTARQRRTRRQRAHLARRHRLHVGARPAPVLQAGQARPGALRHAGSLERAHRGGPAAAARHGLTPGRPPRERRAFILVCPLV